MPSVKRIVRPIFFIPWVKRVVDELPVVRNVYSGWERKHPFDREYGTDTSGSLTAEEIHPDPRVSAQIFGYAASQPSILRRTLNTIPNVQDYTFIDLGCGKGRAALIAGEFPFIEVIGVELSPELARAACRNVEKIQARQGRRSKVSIRNQNISDLSLPEGKLVLYMYQAFGPGVLADLVSKLKETLASGWTTHAYVVYVNPVFGYVLDAATSLQRWFAETLAYDRSEVGFGPDDSDSVVIWQSLIGALPDFDPNRGREIVILKENLHAGLVSTQKN